MEHGTLLDLMDSPSFLHGALCAVIVGCSAGLLAAAPPTATSVVALKHPRLFVSPGALPALRARAKGPLSQIYQQHVKRDSEAPLDEKRLRFTLSNSNFLIARALSLLVCWKVEGEESYRRKAFTLARAIADDVKGKTRRDTRIRLQTLAILYDWLFDALTAKERVALRSSLVEAYRNEAGSIDSNNEGFVSGHAHFTVASRLIAALSLCDGSGEFEREVERSSERWSQFVAVARWVAIDGGHHLGWRYGRSYAARLAWVTEALTTALGKDRFEAEKAWLSQLGYHLAYGLRPDYTYLRSGDTHRGIHVNLEEDLVLLGILSSRYKDSHLAWFAQRIVEFCAKSGVVPSAQFVYALLFSDPSIPSRPPGDLPPVRAFARAGNYVMRTGWDESDTVVLFRAMPWYHFNHEHRDFGSFLIYHRGGLAIQGGLYMGGDNDSHYGGSHLRNYAWRTVAHNTITVFDPTERFCAPAGKGHERCEGDNRWSNDGGQKIRSPFNDDVRVPSFQPRDVAEIEDPRFAQGKVTAHEDADEFTLIVADGTQAYRGDKVRLFERRFLFLKRAKGWKHPVVVIFDRVISRKPELKKTWNLHTVQVPQQEGRVFIVTNSTRVRMSGDVREKSADHWNQYSGKLHVETLLPSDATLQFVGGEGKEFWVDGVNYPARVRDIDRIVEPGIGRIEVSPNHPNTEDFFLHVLSPTELGDATRRPEGRRLEAHGAIAARVSDWAIVLAGLVEPQAEITYDAGEAAISGSTRHLITGLPPSRKWSASGGGASQEVQSSRQGIIFFTTSSGGKFVVKTR